MIILDQELVTLNKDVSSYIERHARKSSAKKGCDHLYLHVLVLGGLNNMIKKIE